MRYDNKDSAIIVAATTPEEFELKLNKVFNEISGCKYNLVFPPSVPFCAYITVSKKIAIPETAEDEYELLGIHFYCAECPNYVIPFDGRIKYTDCKMGTKCKAGDSACEWLYREVKAGRISIESDEEEKVA